MKIQIGAWPLQYRFMALLLVCVATGTSTPAAGSQQCGTVTLNCQRCTSDVTTVYHVCLVDDGCTCGTNHDGNCGVPAACSYTCGGTLHSDYIYCSDLPTYSFC